MKKIIILLFLFNVCQAQTYVKLDPNSADNSLILQQAVDSVRDKGTIDVWAPSGYYQFQHPVIFQNYQANRGIYFNFTVRLHGTGTYASADGTGTIFDFHNCTSCAFGIGIQAMKGGGIEGITMIGRWADPGLSCAAFYNANGLGNGLCKNTPNGPEAAIAIDPFGLIKTGPDTYNGTDAYGNQLSGYYKGGKNGSTGLDIHDMKFQHWLVGIITSPNGYTQNAELMHWYKQNMAWVRFPYIGCQDQEKQNEIGPEIMIWGVTETCFQLAHGWGASSAGNYHCHDWNVAGPVQSIYWINESGYFQNQFDHITTESLGKLGYWHSGNGSSLRDSKVDFANYIDETFAYPYPQIDGMGVTYENCQFRMYGTSNPITINNHDGYNQFVNCAFEAQPYFNTDYPYGKMVFQYCKVNQADCIMNASIHCLGPLPQQYQPTYRITPTLVGNYYQATINCLPNVLDSLRIGSIIAASDNRSIQQGIAGIVSDIGTGCFTIKYIPKQIISGNDYYLFSWY